MCPQTMEKLRGARYRDRMRLRGDAGKFRRDSIVRRVLCAIGLKASLKLCKTQAPKRLPCMFTLITKPSFVFRVLDFGSYC